MSVEAMTWAFAQAIPPAPKIVLLALANSANKAGVCWPGLEVICDAVKPMKLRMVQYHIKALERAGALTRTARSSERSGVQLSNLYTLSLGTTIAWGEGATSCTLEGATSCTGRVQELLQGEGATAVAPPDKNLEPSAEPSEEHLVGLAPDPKGLWQVAEELLGFLNRKTGKHFQPRKPNKDPTTSLKAVHALLKQGFSEPQIRQVIANRLLKWGDDPNMREFLRPDTLFRPSKFEQYLGELGAA